MRTVASQKAARSRPARAETGSATVFVTLEALCRRADDERPTVLKIEEQIPLTAILGARKLSDATQYFLSQTDTISDILEVHSIKVNGHEFLHTFLI